MAARSQRAVPDFARERGGRERHVVGPTEHFGPALPEVKSYVVDSVAFVEAESGGRHVCLRNRFRGRGGKATAQKRVRNKFQMEGESSREARGGLAAGGRRARPGSGYGSGGQVSAPHELAAADDRRGNRERVRAADRAQMGNAGSCKPQKKRNSKRETAGKAPEVPQISVIEASPLPAEGAVFSLPEQSGRAGLSPEAGSGSGSGLGSGSGSVSGSGPGAQPGLAPGQQDSEDEEGQFDTRSLSGSDGNGTPKGSRGHFIQVMMDASPQVRRSMALRRSAHLSSRSDCDSASLASSCPDEDRSPVALDPLEHEWMMCASDGEWDGLHHLLNVEPGLILRRDFVTGFTCLHWAAKQGKAELVALLLNFAKQRGVPASVDVRSSAGYTPLHVAAMHDHMEVVKLLVGAYGADVDLRDHSGRKACQYLTDGASVDIRDIIGAYEQSHSQDAEVGGRWRFSRVLPSNLRPLWLLNPGEWDPTDGEGRPREKPLRRKSSLGGMKPRLQRLRARTSQIVHSTSFHGAGEQEAPEGGSFKSRPKTHFFG